MSDTVVSFIPKVCDFLPEQTEINAIEVVASDLFEGCTEISINKAYELPFFIDSGQNHEAIFCPKCDSEIKVEFWQQKMESCWVEQSRGFNFDVFSTQCCNEPLCINEFVYVPHQGFARFSVEVTNPKINRNEEMLAKLRELTKQEFCIVNAYY
mgnify:CR=1 FL=1